MTRLTKEQALILLAKTTMREFTKDDWMSFAGCESANPMIGEYENEWTIVVDGSMINTVHVDDQYGGQLFRLEDA